MPSRASLLVLVVILVAAASNVAMRAAAATPTPEATITAPSATASPPATEPSGTATPTSVAGAATTPAVLAEPTSIAGCAIPAGAVEVTTQAARDHRQRVFDVGPASRIYAGVDGQVCVTLNAAPPFPDFAPDQIPHAPGVPSKSAPHALPGTGTAPYDPSPASRPAAVILSACGIVIMALGAMLRRYAAR